MIEIYNKIEFKNMTIKMYKILYFINVNEEKIAIKYYLNNYN
jgi:hypothetical protein